jgi:hypothetical protein
MDAPPVVAICNLLAKPNNLKSFMKPKTIEELEKENADLRKLAESRSKDLLIESRVIRLLVAAELVTNEKIEEARSLASSLR